MRFKGLDLNLLVALQALLDERSVSGAAKRVHISQPGMSASLKRLREYFNDDLLQADGKRMVPTPHALQIQPHLNRVLANINDFVSETTNFDPKTSRRTFVVTASDYIASVLLSPLVPRLAHEAPNVSLKIIPPADSTSMSVQQGIIDLAILPSVSMQSAMPSKFLMKEDFVLVGCKHNPMFSRDITIDDFCTAKHIVVRLGRINPNSVADDKLTALGIERNECIQAASFLAAPQMVINTPYVTTMHRRLAEKYTAFVPIAVHELPFELPPMEEHVFYNRAREKDAGMIWLRKLIENQVSIIDGD